MSISHPESQPRLRRSARGQTTKPGIERARLWEDILYEDHSSGDRYNIESLGLLFETVLQNPAILAASLQNLLSTRGLADVAILRFAAALPDSQLVAVNLGEYTVTPDTWDILLEAIKHSQLGHLYISEENLSNLRSDQKVAMRKALESNRSGMAYLACVVMYGTRLVRAVRYVKPWFSPPDTSAWLQDKKARLGRLL